MKCTQMRDASEAQRRIDGAQSSPSVSCPEVGRSRHGVAVHSVSRDSWDVTKRGAKQPGVSLYVCASITSRDSRAERVVRERYKNEPRGGTRWECVRRRLVLRSVHAWEAPGIKRPALADGGTMTRRSRARAARKC